MKHLLFILFLLVGFQWACTTKSPKKNTSQTFDAEVRAKLIGDLFNNLATAIIAATDGTADVTRTGEGINITFQPDFHFESNTAELNENSKIVLGKIANVLNEYPYTELFIEGHADSSGNQDFNKRLSQLRAKNVAIFLRDHGVKANRIAIAGYGATRPIASNDTPEGRKQNRRVIVKIRAREDEFLESVKSKSAATQN